ncbi:MAG: hypothetical protein Q4G64_08195, partial [bacterium]|nr:hypothetical protein [bacterium]
AVSAQEAPAAHTPPVGSPALPTLPDDEGSPTAQKEPPAVAPDDGAAPAVATEPPAAQEKPEEA